MSNRDMHRSNDMSIETALKEIDEKQAGVMPRLNRSAEESIRMECLQLAVRGKEGHHHDKILENAKAFEKFVKGEK
jgi:hypothetical protein